MSDILLGQCAYILVRIMNQNNILNFKLFSDHCMFNNKNQFIC